MTHPEVHRVLPALLVTLALAAGGCNVNRARLGELPGSGPRTRDTLMAQPTITTPTAREAVEKRVDVKRAPRTLVAPDASWCTVSDERFADTRLGDYVRCAWVER